MAKSSAERDRLIRRRGRRLVFCLAAGLVLALAALARPAVHLARVAMRDVAQAAPIAAGSVDDASRLNQTAVAEVASFAGEPADRDRYLKALIERAGREHLHVSIAGARHTMGGHTIYPGGLAINMLPFHRMALDEARNLLHVEAGATWAQVVPYLDAHGRSVAVMQSNNSFSVGGSLSANCHGWQFASPPIASTVESFRLLMADGQIVRCSRGENAELFSAVLGGYGLLGIILDVDLRVVPNQRYRHEQSLVAVERAMDELDRRTKIRPDVAMAYGRLNVDRNRFLTEMILTVFYPDPAADGSLPPLADRPSGWLERLVFRGSAGSDFGKRFRWRAETRLAPRIMPTHFSRNQLLSEGVELFQQHSDQSTDILHEYFVPRARWLDFVARARRIIPRHQADLLNVTVRWVETDQDSLLRYADQPLVALVMLLDQLRSQAGEADMLELTGELIDAALACEGRYYLPYRLHASGEQFRRAYPQAERFFALKWRHDPQELFQNGFYLKYRQP